MRRLVTAVLTVAAIGLFTYGAHTLWMWWSDRYPVVEFTGGELSKPVARPDDVLIAYLYVRKLRDCPGVTQRRLSGGCGEHLVSETATYLPKGFFGKVTLPFQIPQYVIPGDCSFVVHTWFVCNPFDFWRDRHYSSKPIPFRVLGYDE